MIHFYHLLIKYPELAHKIPCRPLDYFINSIKYKSSGIFFAYLDVDDYGMMFGDENNKHIVLEVFKLLKIEILNAAIQERPYDDIVVLELNKQR